MNRQAIALTCLLLVIVALASCQRSNLIGGVERISDKGFAEVKVLSVEVTPGNVAYLDFGVYEWRWGSEDPADTRQVTEIQVQIPGRTIVLTGAVLSGIKEIRTDDVHVLTKGNDALIKLRGGDACGAYFATILIEDSVTKRFCEHGEMGEETCESMTITKDRVIINTHDEFEP